MAQTLMVSGASGRLGRRALEHLLTLHDGPLIAGTRTPDSLADLAQRGVTVRMVDFAQPETLADAYQGVDRLLIVSSPSPQSAAQHRAAIDAAVRAGVKHVVYTSLPNPERHNGFLHTHIETEQYLNDSPLSWTILRNNIYTEYITQLQDLTRAIATGELISATDHGAISYVTREDCARAAAYALASTDSERRIYNITGPESITHDQLAAIVSEVTGKPVKHVAVNEEQLAELLKANGTPEQWIPALVHSQRQQAEGVMDVMSDAVEALTGSAPTSVRAYFAEHRNELLGEAKADSFMTSKS